MAIQAAQLRPHPAHAADAIRRLDVVADARSVPSRLRLRFRIEADVARLRLPEPAAARRCDGLWQHSCFEAFLRPDASDIYYEFNFAPTGDWAAYRFAGRREGRTSPDLAAPAIRITRGAERFELTAEVDLPALPELARARAIRAGLAAVIESDTGALSYWALAHGGERPDFHDPATFLLHVPPP
jgi:hypothetical protein